MAFIFVKGKMTSTSKSHVDINDVLDRVAALVGADSDARLATELGTTSQVIHGWRKRGTIPYEKLVEFATRPDVRASVSLDYLLFGKDEEHEAQRPKPIRIPQFGAVIGFRFDRGGIAEVAMSRPEVDRILECIREIEESTGEPNAEVLEAVQIVRNHLWDLDERRPIELIAEALFAAYAVRMEPVLQTFQDTADEYMERYKLAFARHNELTEQTEKGDQGSGE